MSRMLRTVFFCLVIVLTVLSCASCGGMKPYETEAVYDLVYKTTPEGELTLDLFYPTKRVGETNPAVLLFHGGGWISGTKEEFCAEIEPLIGKLRESGFLVAGVDYRFALGGETWRDLADDCEDALRFLVENAADYDADPERIGLIGYSAGAHLALLTALETKDAAAVCVSLSGPVTFDRTETAFWSDALTYYGGSLFAADDSDGAREAAAPINRLDRSCTTSFLLVNGADDPIVPPCHAERFAETARAAGMDAECRIVDGLTHSYASFSGRKALCREIAAALIEMIGKN